MEQCRTELISLISMYSSVSAVSRDIYNNYAYTDCTQICDRDR